MDHIHTFLTTQGHGGPPRMSDQPNAGATSETALTWKTIHTKHTLSHPNKANMEWWLRRPNDIRRPWGPKVSWHFSYRWGKTPKKPHPGNLYRPGIEPGPAAWHARPINEYINFGFPLNIPLNFSNNALEWEKKSTKICRTFHIRWAVLCKVRYDIQGM